MLHLTYSVSCEHDFGSVNIRELDAYLQNYVTWISENLPFKNEGGKSLNCVDLIVIENRNEDSFIELLMLVISESIPISIRLRNENVLFRSKNFIPCEMIFLIDYTEDEKTRFENIQRNGIITKSKYFLVLIPPTSNLIQNPLEWPTEIFTHSDVIVVVNLTIFHLQSPFELDRRDFDIITDGGGGYIEWIPVNRPDSNFNGKHLRVMTLNCDVHNYWEPKRPSQEDDVCGFYDENNVNCGK